MAVAVRSAKASNNGAGSTTLDVLIPGIKTVGLRAAQGSNNAGGATSITMTMPAGVQDGDVLLMAVTARGGSGTTISPGAAWTALGTMGYYSTTVAQGIYWRVASSEPASYSVGLSSSLKASGVIIALTDADPSTPAATQYNGRANASSATVTSNALSLGSFMVGMEVVFSGTAYGTTCTPVTLTEPANGESASTGGGANSRTTTEVEYGTYSGSAPPQRTATMADAAVNIGHHIFIKAAADPTALTDGDVLVLGVSTAGGNAAITDPPSKWTGVNANTGGYPPYLAYGNGVWVAWYGTTQYATATDPLGTWTSRAFPWSGQCNAVLYGNSTWVALLSSGQVWTTSDPTGAWTQGSAAIGTNYGTLFYGNGHWCTVKAGGELFVATDPAGTWTRNSDASWTITGYPGLTYDSGNGNWVAILGNTTTGRLLTAADPEGVWTAQTFPWSNNDSLLGLTYANGRLVAYRNTLTNDYVVWSTDGGVNWSQSDAVAAGYFALIGWDAASSRWWGLETTAQVWVSDTCQTWTQIDRVPVSGSAYSLVYDADHGVWAGVWSVTGSNLDTRVTTDLEPYWRALGTNVNNSAYMAQQIYWRIADSEPSSYTFTISSSRTASAVVVVLSGADTTFPVAAQYGGQANLPTSVSIVAPALGTWASTSGVDVGFFGTPVVTTISPPTDYTEPTNGEGSSSGTTTEASYRALTSVTTVGSITATAVATGENIGHHVFIQEPPPAATEADAEVATGTGTAQQPSVSIKPSASTAEGIGTALQATVSVGGANVEAHPGVASGTGVAFDADIIAQGAETFADAGNAAGTGAANAPTTLVAPNAGTAQGVGTAFNASASQPTLAYAGFAAGIGMASDARAAPGKLVTPATAQGTGVAPGPSISIMASAGVAVGIGQLPTAKLAGQGIRTTYRGRSMAIHVTEGGFVAEDAADLPAR